MWDLKCVKARRKRGEKKIITLQVRVGDCRHKISIDRWKTAVCGTKDWNVHKVHAPWFVYRNRRTVTGEKWLFRTSWIFGIHVALVTKYFSRETRTNWFVEKSNPNILSKILGHLTKIHIRYWVYAENQISTFQNFLANQSKGTLDIFRDWCNKRYGKLLSGTTCSMLVIDHINVIDDL